jgi:hypothetical protein
MLGTAGFVGAGTAVADSPFGGPGGGPDFQVTQSTQCRSHDLNLSILSNLGLLNGLGGNLANGEGNPGQTAMKQGSEMGCNNSAF